MISRSRNVIPLMTLATALSLSACATAPGPEITGSGQCHAESLDWAIGKNADEATMRSVFKQSGAGLIVPIGPGSTIATGDRRPDRLRVFLDKNNIITAIRCE
ncbi:hypothetical protein [Stenotrophomonas sp. AB1(2024)]|uniref:hypothetical protein n=1 Tax=Stenotrophomonas sp. AB1(2024) TaxID=3132215 RepID=UPI0030A8ADE3